MGEPGVSYKFAEHARERPFTRYLSTAAVGSLMLLLGSVVWPKMGFYSAFPNRGAWLRHPDPGLVNVHPGVLVAALLALGIVAVAVLSRRWHPDLLLVAITVAILEYALQHHATIAQSGEAQFEPGLYLVLGGCLLLGISGVFSYVLHLRLRWPPSLGGGFPRFASTQTDQE